MFRWNHKAVRRKTHEVFYEIAEEPKNHKYSEMIDLNQNSRWLKSFTK
ncbi:protein of unknown function [Paenibacillus alvei]|uniref:Uncharacterized protein n=1 Tax=Paenibacillus alvei TaxID=44250 RepID=A0A383R9Z7_PAEAL|nr:protein of unknown function [Paenibacillus alvei]